MPSFVGSDDGDYVVQIVERKHSHFTLYAQRFWLLLYRVFRMICCMNLWDYKHFRSYSDIDSEMSRIAASWIYKMILIHLLVKYLRTKPKELNTIMVYKGA